MPGADADQRQTISGKGIGFAAGCTLLFNSAGQGIGLAPNVFAEAGWLVTSLAMLGVWLATSLIASMLCEAVQGLPEDELFQGRAEYSTVVRHYFGQRWCTVAQVSLYAVLLSLNVDCIVQGTRAMDGAASALFGTSCALNLTPFENSWRDDAGTLVLLPESKYFVTCIDAANISAGNPWGCHVLVTIGFLVTVAMVFPSAGKDLQDDIIVQLIAAVITTVCWIACMVISLAQMEYGSGSISAGKPSRHLLGIVGVMLLDFRFVTTMPSWIGQKQPDASVNKTLWFSTGFCMLMYVAVGLAGALTFSDNLQRPFTHSCPAVEEEVSSVSCHGSFLGALMDPDIKFWGIFMVHISAYLLFPTLAVLTRIPVAAIVMRDNLVESGFAARPAWLLSFVLPALLALPLAYMPASVTRLLDFTSLACIIFTDFVVPLCLYAAFQLQGRGQAEAELPGVAADRTDPPAERRKTGQTLGHFAIPPSWRWPPLCKAMCAFVMIAPLVLVATAAIVVEGKEHHVSIDGQVCASVK